MLIDLKDPKLVPAVVEAFKEHPRLVDMALVSSFNPLVIYKVCVEFCISNSQN